MLSPFPLSIMLNLSNPLTALQTVSQLLLLHSPKEVQCDLHKCLSAAPPLLLLLPLTLWALWVIWTQNSLHLLQLLLHKTDNVFLQQLEQKNTWSWTCTSQHQIMCDRQKSCWSAECSMETGSECCFTLYFAPVVISNSCACTFTHLKNGVQVCLMLLLLRLTTGNLWALLINSVK